MKETEFTAIIRINKTDVFTIEHFKTEKDFNSYFKDRPSLYVLFSKKVDDDVFYINVIDKSLYRSSAK